VESLLHNQNSSHEGSVTSPEASLSYSTAEPQGLNEPGRFGFEDPCLTGIDGGQQHFEDDFDPSTGPIFCEPSIEPVWDIMEVGLNEPLPIPEVLDEL
jgi:hypothetical protein